MTALSTADVAAIDLIESAATGVLTLAEGLDADELSRSRLTQFEVRRGLLQAASAALALSERALASMPELDVSGWRHTKQRLDTPTGTDAHSVWFAVQALAPATIGWIRFYRARHPELFSATSP
ncbi:MAG TPA: hypothetical protein VFQ35_27445 [Polyangiaceae bacterium]|nr:hypothetical protein [Polyangiaceae bacterium]